MDDANGVEAAGWAKAPPYVSYKAFRTYVDRVAASGLPAIVLRRDLEAQYSGTVITQLLAALRFLRLTDDQDQPTERFRYLLDAMRARHWPQTWGEVLRAAYAPVFALDLQSLSAEDLEAAFRCYPGESDAVRRKCLSFFLLALRDAEIPVSAGIRDMARRSRSSEAVPDLAPRVRTLFEPRTHSPNPADLAVHGGQDVQTPPPSSPVPNNAPENPYRFAFNALSAVWDPDEMGEDVDAAVVTILRHLRKKEKEAKT